MTYPQLSPEQKAQAEKIFKRGLSMGLVLGLIAIVLFSLIIFYVSIHVFHIHLFGGLTALWGSVGGVFIRRFALWWVRRSGLSQERVEHHSIHKTAEDFTGPPLNVYSDSTTNDGAVGVIFLAFLFALLVCFQIGGIGFPPFFVGLCVFVLSVGLTQALFRLSDPPVLHLDGQGVFNSAQHFWPQRASWANIRKAEYLQMFDYKGDLATRKLIFRMRKGRDVVIVFPKPQFSDQQVHEILAQVEAILTGESKISDA